MTNISIISAKSFLLKIADIFQNREGLAANSPKEERSTTNHSNNQRYLEREVNPKLNVSLGDLKVISTALLHYSFSHNYRLV